MTTCSRCGWTDRPDRFRTSLVNLAREAARDRRSKDGPDYGLETRCIDRDACERRHAAVPLAPVREDQPW